MSPQDKIKEMLAKNPEQLINNMGNEIMRLQKLCRDNKIDPTPPKPMSPGASLKTDVKITVFKTKEEADEAMEKSMQQK